VKSRFIILFVIIAFFSLSCASIFKGSTEVVNFGSEPSRAKVYINGQYFGITPLEMELKSNKSYTIEFRKEGYHNKTVMVTNHVGAGWIILDIIGGLIPIIVDAATGSWMELNQTNVNAALEME
jgi:hypothetical protein